MECHHIINFKLLIKNMFSVMDVLYMVRIKPNSFNSLEKMKQNT